MWLPRQKIAHRVKFLGKVISVLTYKQQQTECCHHLLRLTCSQERKIEISLKKTPPNLNIYYIY